MTSRTTLNFNGAVANRQYRYTADINREYYRRDDSFTWLPSLEDTFSPFWQVYGEIEHYFPGGSSIISGIAYTAEKHYNYSFPEMTEETDSIMLPISLNYKINSFYSLQLSAEHQRFKDSLRAGKHFSNQIVTLGFSKAPYINFALTSEFLSKGYDISDKTSWVNGTVQFRFRSKHIFEITFGDSRGGLICNNGLCRYVPPFEGWKFQLSVQI